MATGNWGTVCVGVVDDDESLRRSFARLLRAAGMQAITYASAEAFCADPQRPRLDCLVLDVQLPGMSGIDLRNRLAAEGVATPVLFVTAYDDPSAFEGAMAGRCLGYFHKTDAGSAILTAIRQAVAPPEIGR
jgi:FixJ family two-component response regulator